MASRKAASTAATAARTGTATTRGLRKRPQSALTVDAREREQLNRLKQRYEQQKGGEVDWGEFLTAAAWAGLAALTLYAVAKANRQGERAAAIDCPHCRQRFALAIPSDSPLALPMDCPLCGREMVVNLAGIAAAGGLPA